MSFILDALKKSESERQQQATPGFADVPSASPRPGAPRGLLVLLGILSLAVVALLIALLKSENSPPVAGQAVSTRDPVIATRVAQDAPATSPPVAMIDRVDEPAAPAVPATVAAIESPTATVPENRPTAGERPGSVTENLPAAGPGAAPADPPSAAPDAEPESTEAYLTFNELRATGAMGLPDMHIDLHVYSERPAERFVFINMNQYRENATLTEGPRLRQITTDGVLLEYVGTTFLLPRE